MKRDVEGKPRRNDDCGEDEKICLIHMTTRPFATLPYFDHLAFNHVTLALKDRPESCPEKNDDCRDNEICLIHMTTRHVRRFGQTLSIQIFNHVTVTLRDKPESCSEKLSWPRLS